MNILLSILCYEKYFSVDFEVFALM